MAAKLRMYSHKAAGFKRVDVTSESTTLENNVFFPLTVVEN